MQCPIKTVNWRFSDIALAYPELQQQKIYIRSPQDVYNNFLFLFKQQVKERFIAFLA